MAPTTGDQLISTLVIGNVVLAYDEASGELGYFAVIDTIVHEDPVVQYLTIDGETITTTPNHPFKTGTGKWVTAVKLQVGNTIRTAQRDTGYSRSFFTTGLMGRVPANGRSCHRH